MGFSNRKVGRRADEVYGTAKGMDGGAITKWYTSDSKYIYTSNRGVYLLKKVKYYIFNK